MVAIKSQSQIRLLGFSSPVAAADNGTSAEGTLVGHPSAELRG
jgi:hypothetical protein